jgi:ABC-type transport system substrate-binding protein
VVALVVLAATLALAGWLALQEDGPFTTASPPGVLRISVGAQFNSLDPAQATTPAERTLQAVLFEGVVSTGETLAPEPRLAETLPQPSTNGLTWTIHCRRDVRFHDRKPFTCHDIQARLDNLRINTEMLAGNDGDADPSTLIALLERIESIEAVDDYTLSVHLRAPFAFFNEALAHPAAVISRGEFGTGPFEIESWDTESATLVAFDDYWGGTPELEGVTLQVIQDPTARLAALGDTFDVVADPPPDAPLNDETHVLVSGPGAQVIYLAINPNVSPLDNPQIREALRLGIGWDTVASQAFGGYARPAPLLTGPAMPGYENVTPIQPDLRRARELQANMGLPDGYDTALYLDRRAANWQRLTEVLRFQIEALYIEGEAETLSVPLEEVLTGDSPLALVVTAHTPMDAYAALSWLAEPSPPQGGNFVGYENATYRAFIEQAISAPTAEEREVALDNARNELANDPPFVFLVSPDVLAATTDEVVGLRLSPLGWPVVTRDTLIVRR